MHIGTLRKKIEAVQGAQGGQEAPNYIKTVWGVGYKFTTKEEE
ncbi:MAG TPA: helix-turn-helix domain-containing protein [Ktedonobacteraceae bacterium]